MKNKLSTLSTLLKNASCFEAANSVDILKYSIDKAEAINFETGETVKIPGNIEGALAEQMPVLPARKRRETYSEGGEKYIIPAEKVDKNNNIIAKNITIDSASTIKNSRIGSELSKEIGTITSSDISGSTIEHKGSISITEAAIHNSSIYHYDSGAETLLIKDAAIVDSKIYGKFSITNAVSITNSSLDRGGKLDYHVTVTNSNLESVNLYATVIEQSNLKNIKSMKHTTVKSSVIENAEKIYDCIFEDSNFSVREATSSTCLNIKDMYFTKLTCAAIENCTREAGAGYLSIEGNNKSNPVNMVYATIGGTPVISGSAKIRGYANQYAYIGGSATVTGNAIVAGHVIGNAVVFGNAKVEGKCTISGDCRVGGDAHMMSGTYTTGEYLTGQHSGGTGGLFGTIREELTDSAYTANSFLNSAYRAVKNN